MATNPLSSSYLSAVKRQPLSGPWRFLDRITPYQDAIHNHPARKTTMPTSVQLYDPILKAIWSLGEGHPLNGTYPYRIVEQNSFSATGSSKMFILEAGLDDDSSLVVTVKGQSIRISHCSLDASGAVSSVSILPFANESSETLTAIFLATLFDLTDTDAESYGSKFCDTCDFLIDLQGADSWADKNDISEQEKNAFYCTDIAQKLFKEKEYEFGSATSNCAEEVDINLLTNASTMLAGELLAERLDNWTPKFVRVSGKANKQKKKKMTIKEAKDLYSGYTAHRKWTDEEKMLIPQLPDNMPVMKETLYIAETIVRTREQINPVVNGMWRGVTSYGKSTGIKQLAAILNIPLLIITCHPSMEISEFKSTYVPASGEDPIDLDMRNVVSAKWRMESSDKPPFFVEAMSHVETLSDDLRAELMDTASFFENAVMDSETATELLLGRMEEIALCDLLNLYHAVIQELNVMPMRTRIATLEAAGNQEEAPKDSPQFIHVISNYVKALVNGYLIEIQEASRIRDSGVLVGLNEYDRPGATIHMMNGHSARRHKDAICIITDNVGYTSCRPIDPSVIRRQGFIIDSYDLPREMVIDRVKLNTGCNDATLLDLAYNLWDTVKTHCEHNSITEGSVSPMELERFVQAVMFGGPDTIAENLNNCIISKATSSIEDQREIRAACALINPMIAA